MTLISEPILLLFRNRRTLFASLILEGRQSYAGSAGGVAWLFVGPVALMAIYVAIYALVLRVSVPGLSTYQYISALVVGLGAFIGFAQGLSNGMSSLLANKNVLLNTVYPAELLAPKSSILSSVVILIGACVAVVIVGFSDGASATWVILPLLLVAQILFTTGIAYVLSVVSIAVRDIQFATAYVIICLMIASPIAYRPEMVPDALAIVLYINPLSYFIIAYQDAVLGHWPSIGTSLAVFGLSTFSFLGGATFFRATKRAIADRL
ncbi:MAG: transport permease protein [Alphaproteobacteria bacterium]|nr:MAG: transport permease protein [Alphaproteobacteria bacterium]